MSRSTPALCCLLLLTGCDELPPGDMTSPYYWGDYFLDKYDDELEAAMDELEPGPEPLAEPRTVLLITGVTIPAAWMEPIVLRLERDGFHAVVYEPPALLSGSLLEASEELGEIVEQVQAESGQDRIDILAECTGGLIARHYVQSLGGDAHVERLVTFVSPQNGIEKAPMAASIAGWPALTDLSPGSDFLQAVQDTPLPESVAMTSIYTCTDEYIQPYQTSIVEGATNIGLCDGFVGHFQTMYDPEIYLIMHEALIEGLDDTAFGEGAPDDDALAEDTPAEGTPAEGAPDDSDSLDEVTFAGCAAVSPSSGLLALLLPLLSVRRRKAPSVGCASSSALAAG